jgi:hypothetical protein
MAKGSSKVRGGASSRKLKRQSPKDAILKLLGELVKLVQNRGLPAHYQKKMAGSLGGILEEAGNLIGIAPGCCTVPIDGTTYEIETSQAICNNLGGHWVAGPCP